MRPYPAGLFSESQEKILNESTATAAQRAEITSICQKAAELYISKDDKYIRDGIFDRLVADPAEAQEVGEILSAHQLHLEQHKRVTVAYEQARAAKLRPGEINVGDYAEQTRRMISGAGEAGVSPRAITTSEVGLGFGDGALTGISRESIEWIKNEYEPHHTGLRVDRMVERAIDYARKETRGELAIDKARIENYLEHGEDLDKKEIEKLQDDITWRSTGAKRFASRAKRAGEVAVSAGSSALYGLVKHCTRGILSESEAQDDSGYKKYIEKRNELLSQLLHKLASGPSAHLAIEQDEIRRMVDEATAGSGDVLDQVAFEKLQKLIGDEMLRTGQVSEEKLKMINDKMAALNKSMLEEMKSEDGHLTTADDMMKFRALQIMMMVTPFGALGAFNYISELTDIFGPLFDGGPFAEGFSQFLNNIPIIGDIAHFLRIDDFFEWALNNVPIIEQVGDVVDAVTDNQIFQGVGDTVGPMQFSPVTLLAGAAIGAAWGAKSEIDLHKKVTAFNEKHEKAMEQAIEGFEKDFDKRQEADIKNYVDKKFNILSESEIEAQTASFLHTLKSVSGPQAEGMFNLIFEGVRGKGGFVRNVWDIVRDPNLDDPSKIATAIADDEDEVCKQQVQKRFAIYKAVEEELKSKGYTGEELREKALKEMSAILIAERFDPEAVKERDKKEFADDIGRMIKEGGNQLFGAEYADAINKAKNSGEDLIDAIRKNIAGSSADKYDAMKELRSRVAMMRHIRLSNAATYNAIAAASTADPAFDFNSGLIAAGVAVDEEDLGRQARDALDDSRVSARRSNPAEERNYSMEILSREIKNLGVKRLPLNLFGSKYSDAIAQAIADDDDADGLMTSLANEIPVFSERAELRGRVAIMSELYDSNRASYDRIVANARAAAAAAPAPAPFDFDAALAAEGIATREARDEIVDKRLLKERAQGTIDRSSVAAGLPYYIEVRDIADLQKRTSANAIKAKVEKGEKIVKDEMVARIGKKRFDIEPYSSPLTDRSPEALAKDGAMLDNYALRRIDALAYGAGNKNIFGAEFVNTFQTLPRAVDAAGKFDDKLFSRGLFNKTCRDLSARYPDETRAEIQESAQTKLEELNKRALIISSLRNNQKATYDKMMAASEAVGFDFYAELQNLGITVKMADEIYHQEKKDLTDIRRLREAGESGVKRENLATFRESYDKSRDDYVSDKAKTIRSMMEASLLQTGKGTPTSSPRPEYAERFAALSRAPVAVTT